MKVLIITQGVSRLVPALLDSSHEIVGIVESANRNYNKHDKLFKLKRFMLNALSFIGRDIADLKIFCHKNKIPYFFMTSNR